MAQNTKFRGKRQRKSFHKQRSFKAPVRTEQVWIDYDKLPADLDEAQLKELMDSLPKKRSKPKPTSYAELQAMNMTELHEVAEAEKVAADLTGGPGDQQQGLVCHGQAAWTISGWNV